jgi:hypothetical protein
MALASSLERHSRSPFGRIFSLPRPGKAFKGLGCGDSPYKGALVREFAGSEADRLADSWVILQSRRGYMRISSAQMNEATYYLQLPIPPSMVLTYFDSRPNLLSP